MPEGRHQNEEVNPCLPVHHLKHEAGREAQPLIDVLGFQGRAAHDAHADGRDVQRANHPKVTEEGLVLFDGAGRQANEDAQQGPADAHAKNQRQRGLHAEF